MIVNMHDAKRTLPKLLKAAVEGEEVIIAKAGKPMIRLQPIPRANRRGLGRFEGEIKMDNFFHPLPEDELQGWER